MLINEVHKTINCWWPSMPVPGNFGDVLTPWLIHRMSGYSAIRQHKPFRNKTLLGIGSILGFANEQTVVWGSGLMTSTTKPDTRSTYLAVRGPISRDAVLAQGLTVSENAIGDPALLMPMYYNPIVTKKYKIGIFAHYVDTEQVRNWYSNDSNILVINPLNAHPTKVIDLVLQCERIVSSSLHGIIISHAYGIPAAWVKHSNKLAGDDVKFYDYFESVQLPRVQPIQFYEKIEYNEMLKFNYVADIKFDPSGLLKTFPLPLIKP